jgi:ADP-ribosylation factor-binding protein GGA
MSGFTPPKAATPASDPFAALASPQFGSKPATPKPSAPAPAAANDDDEWSFSSALPLEAPSLPKDHSAIVKDGQLRIDLKAVRSPQGPNAVALSFAFSNNTPQPISELHFEVAVTKVRHIPPSPKISLRV